MKTLKTILTCLLMTFLIHANGLAAASEQGMSIEWIQPDSIVVDGVLQEPVYQEGEWQTGFTILRSSALSKNQTFFRLFTDGNQLYFTARIQKSTGQFVSGGGSRDRVLIAQGDHVNLLIRAHKDVSDFFQFQIAPNGHFADIRLMQGGVTREYSWTSSATVASHIDKKNREWIVEMSVPLAELNIDPELDQWYVNVARSLIRQPPEDGTPREISSWIPTPTEIENPTILSPAILPDFDRRPFAWQFNLLGTKILKQNDDYIMRNRFALTNLTGAAQFIKIETNLNQEGLAARPLNLSINHQAREVIEVDIPLGNQANLEVERSIKVLSASLPIRQLISHHDQFHYQYTPVRLELIQPGYRNTIFHTQNLQSVKARFHKLDDFYSVQNLQAGLRDSQGNWFPAMLTETRPDTEWLIEVPGIQTLEEGNHTLEVRYTDAISATPEIQQRTILKVPYQEGEVWIDENGVVYREGEPFPAYGFHYGRRDYTGKYERYLPHMFYSVYLPVWASPPQKKMKESIALLAEQGIYSVVSVASASQNGSKTNQPDTLTEKEENEYRKLALAARNNPNFIGYYLSDEPEWRGLNPARMKAIYDILRETDPWHPVSITNNTDQGILNYQHANDLPNPDPYPIFLKDGGPARHLSRIGIYVDNVTTGEESFRATWVTPQAFNLNYFRRGETSYRGPTATELRAQQTIALIHGALGITWYTENLAWDEPATRSSIPYLSWEYRWLFPWLVKSRPEVLHTAHGLLIGICAAEDGVLLLVVNQEGHDQEFTLQDERIRSIPEWKVAGNSDLHSSSADGLSFSLPPYSTLILASPEVPMAHEEFTHIPLPTWEEVLKHEQEIIRNLYIPENMAHLQNGAIARAVGRGNRWNALTAINGAKEPGSMGYNAEYFKPGQGLEIEFARPITPQKVILYGANVLTGHLELEREDGEWQQVATIQHSEEVWQHEIQFSGFPTTKLRLIAESVAYTSYDSIRVIEIEVYE